jgi:beta-mannosidase
VAAFAAYEGLMLYRCRFGYRLPLGDGMISLRFGGVYYSARVWLNGVLLGEHEGYFAPFEFDVTGILADGENELLVEVHSPEEAEEDARVTIGGVWVRWDGLGPNLNPGGIFRDVALISGGEVRIRGLGSTADHTGRGQAHVELYARRGLWTKLVGTIRPLGFEAPGTEFDKEVRVEPGYHRILLDFRLSQVREWWTWDRGEQPLYEVVLRCAGEPGPVRRAHRRGA